MTVAVSFTDGPVTLSPMIAVGSPGTSASSEIAGPSLPNSFT